MRSRVIRIRRVVKSLDVLQACVRCRVCGREWLAVVDRKTDRPRKGWRRCPSGCNSHRLSKG
jgi:hypothetical protein